MAASDLRPMGVGDIFDATFRFYRNNFSTVVVIALVVFVPYTVVQIIAQSLSPVVEPGEFGAAPPNVTLFVLISMSVLLLYLIVVFPLCSAALVHLISASYLGNPISASGAYSRALPSLFRLLWTSLLVGIAFYVGLILCIVPGIIFMLWFILSTPVVVLERKSGPSAMQRSRELMSGNLDKGFKIGIVLLLMNFALGIGLGIVTVFLAKFPAILAVTQNVFHMLLLPINTAPWVMLYYDLRIRKEAFDLDVLAKSIADTSEPA